MDESFLCDKDRLKKFGLEVTGNMLLIVSSSLKQTILENKILTLWLAWYLPRVVLGSEALYGRKKNLIRHDILFGSFFAVFFCLFVCLFVYINSHALPLQWTTHGLTLQCLSGCLQMTPHDWLSQKSSSRGTFLKTEPMFKPCKLLTKMAVKCPNWPTQELLANLDACGS